jgi:short-subunit dehydrogenase
MAVAADFAARYGPTALVTGASSGIGEQFARVLASLGIDLVLVARRRDRLDALAAELRETRDVEVQTLPVDLAREDFLTPVLLACEGRDVGLVVSNAGFGAKGAHHETDVATLERVLAVNCRAPMLLAHAFAPQLIERGRGGILITGSIEAYQGLAYSAVYAASKAFARSLGEGLWEELRGHGVDVLVLSPGATDTEMLPNSGLSVEDMPTPVMTPESVARAGLEQLGRGPDFVPGLVNRLFVSGIGLLPRRLVLGVTGRAMLGTLQQARRRRESSRPTG